MVCLLLLKFILMKLLSILCTVLLGSTLLSQTAGAQVIPGKRTVLAEPETWKPKQLIEPADLVALMHNSKAEKPIIFNIGVVQNIQGAQNMGAASEKENLKRFQAALQKLPKSTFLVVYCGCCPFEKCPNIRPAFKTLNNLGFNRARLLNLPVNLHTNWISKGYPMGQ